jgi:hypothetical protein
MKILTAISLTLIVLLFAAAKSNAQTGSSARFEVSYPASLDKGPIDGRLLLLLSKNSDEEPRFQINEDLNTQQVFGIDVDGWKPGETKTVDRDAFGYPRRSLNDVPAGEYTVQVVLHRYETFKRGDGHTVKLPMDRGEGQQWNSAPGNLYSTPRKIVIDAHNPTPFKITFDKVIPPVEPPKDTKYIKHLRI